MDTENCRKTQQSAMCLACFTKRRDSSEGFVTIKLNWKFYKVLLNWIDIVSVKPCILSNNHVMNYSFDVDTKMKLFNVRNYLNQNYRTMVLAARLMVITSTSRCHIYTVPCNSFKIKNNHCNLQFIINDFIFPVFRAQFNRKAAYQ